MEDGGDGDVSEAPRMVPRRRGVKFVPSEDTADLSKGWPGVLTGNI
jgi:hypothetical protein